MIPLQLLECRWLSVQVAMEECGIDVLVAASRGGIGTFGNVFYLCGYAPMLRPAYAVLRHEGPPILFASSATDVRLVEATGSGIEVRCSGATDALGGPRSTVEAVVAELRDSGASGPGRVGVAGLGDVVPVADADVLRRELGVVDSSALLACVKRRKEAWEVARVREAFALAGQGYDAAAELLRPGVPAQRVVAEIERVVRAAGALEALVFVATEAAFARRVTPTMLRGGDLVTVLVEVATEDGFWVEQGGLFALGDVPARGAVAAEAAYGILDAVRGCAVPGAPVRRAVELARDLAAAAGLEAGFGVGHGVGTDHDLPRLSLASDDVFAEGDVLSVHPNVIAAESGLGAAVADGFHITDAGAESLSGLPYRVTRLDA